MDFKSSESFFKKDSLDQKSGFAFAERIAKSVLGSKIRFWIHRKNTPKVVTRLTLFSQKGRPGLKCSHSNFLLYRSWQNSLNFWRLTFKQKAIWETCYCLFYIIVPIINFNLKSPGFSEDGKSFAQWKTHEIYGHIYHGLSLHVHVML